MSHYQKNISIKVPVKYGELIVLGYNGLLPNGDETRLKSHFAVCQRSTANGVKPSSIYLDYNKAECTMSFVSEACTVVVEYAPDSNTDMFQIGRSTESPIDFVVTDPESKISRFACRIICQRSPPYTAHIYAAGFDSSNNIFLGEKAVKWQTPDGEMDGLTTNGVLVKHPLHGFTQDSMAGLWREISVCGNAFTLRETYSVESPRGKMVDGESQELVDGSLIDLCGVTLLWRTAEGLARMPTIEHLDALSKDLPRGRPTV